MSTPKYIFYLIYFIFHFLLFFGAKVLIDIVSENDFEEIGKFLNNENLLINKSYVIPFVIFGLILYLINLLLVNLQIRSHKKKVAKLEGEVNSLKAKLYDLQDAKGIERKKSTDTGMTSTEPPKDKPKTDHEGDH